MQDNETRKIENREWIASLDWVLKHESRDRARELLSLLEERAEEAGLSLGEEEAEQLITPYRNTIPAGEEEEYPGDLQLEKSIYNAIRWTAMAIVSRANKRIEGIGGHISTYSSASHLWEVGFHHFFHSYENGLPDLVYFQGHASPGAYARSYLEYRFNESHLDHFRQEVNTEKGLSSYPHPRLMPEYWRFPTVSMGLGPIQAIYQARFLKYLHKRGLAEEGSRRQTVWAMLGDGEMDEPESTGAISIAAREKLNNLIFVINCNLQRLDGPVRGNTKVISELEGLFRGAGWTVIKVIWGSGWEQLFREDESGALLEKFNKLPDGELQHLAQMNAGEMREEFFNGELSALVEDKSDEELNALVRGGHDPVKVYNAYKASLANEEGPTVILAQTVKGFEQGEEAGEGSNVSHNTKKISGEDLKAFRDSLGLDIPDEDVPDMPYQRFEKDSEEYKYLIKRREELGGPLPRRKALANDLKMPDENLFDEFFEGSGDSDVATTMAFVKMLTKLLEDDNIGQYIVPIVPDESRTLGMDSLFRTVGIYAAEGQQYEPVDKGNLLYYKESKQGALLEEGITEAGSMASFIAAGTNHISQPFHTIPFFVFYSMFGFQRIGDLIWAAADARARGFMIGGISGRTSLSGEGLQHTDGQSHLYALAYPNVQAYDPAFAFELAHLIKEGLRRMYAEGEDIMYYITVTNQAYPMPEQPEGTTENLLKGLYRFQKSDKDKAESKVNLMGSGAVMTEVLEAADILEENYGLAADIWSVTSYKALYDNARDVERQNMRKRTSEKNHIEEMLDEAGEAFVAATDYVKTLPLSIAQWIPGDFVALGTDGFGRSDTVDTLRRHFEVDAIHIAYHALYLLMEQGKIEEETLAEFEEEYELKADKENPAGV